LNYNIPMNRNKKKVVFIFGFILGVLCLFCAMNIRYLFSETSPLPLSAVRYWAYQIQELEDEEAVRKIVESRYDLVVIDPTVTYSYDFDARGMINRIKASKASDGHHRKLVLAYIDIGEAEEWRWYWDGHTTYEENGVCRNSHITEIRTWAPWVVACDPDRWAGNYPVAYWDEDWKDIVINGTGLGGHLGLYFNSMLDEVIQDGFDGIYLDWVEAWEMDEVRQRAQNEDKEPGREMLNFIKEMRAYGKRYDPDFIVIQQNSSELVNEVGADALRDAVDGIAQEGVWYDGDAVDDDWNNPDGYDQQSCCTGYYLPRLRTYRAAGFPVLVCDYAVANADRVYDNAAAEGFIAYATRRSLSKLTTTPPTIPAGGEPWPFGSFDTPAEGATISSSVAVTGWALDDGGVESVKIYRWGNEGLVFIGDAVQVEGARPDIEQAYPMYPENTRAGWGYMLLTNYLPNNGNGVFTLEAVATDSTGNSVSLGTKTVTVDNQQAVLPFGALETPAQGGVASGRNYMIWGWVLTPQPNQIPSDGNTISVWVDGINIGHPVYNLNRPDIATLFPGYANSDGAVGYYVLDTTQYENGVHIIQWTAADSAGNTDGIGSRYFKIENN
jgi:uncharacterized protein (TIGR01370 family)